MDYLSEEHPFATPAVFFGFTTLNVADNGELMQTTDLQVDIYVFYETFSDTYNGAKMQKLFPIRQELNTTNGSIGIIATQMFYLSIMSIDRMKILI